MEEIELKFLNINVEEIKSKLIKLGAKLKYDSQIESYSFWADGFHCFDSSKKQLRVRKINDDIKITYKGPSKKSEMSKREEIEISVNNYDQTIKLFEKMGFQKDDVFKKHRIHFELGNIHFELDTLKNIPTYLEIETQTELAMKSVCVKLELNISDGKKGTIIEILPELFK